MKKYIRILLVDDNEIVRRGLRDMLDREEDMNVVGDCASAEDALAQVGALSPDVILMDVQMPGMDGIEATRKLKKNGFSCDASVVILAECGDHLISALEAGAVGYLLKETSSDELTEAIRQVYDGECSTQHRDRLIEELELSIPLVMDAGRLLKFVGQVEETLQATIVQTVGSAKWGADITVSLRPTPMESIVTKLGNIDDVERVEDEGQPGLLRRFRSLLSPSDLPAKKLFVTLKQADMHCQGLAVALN